MPTRIGPDEPPLELLPHAAINNAPHAARLAARNRRLTIGKSPFLSTCLRLPLASSRQDSGKPCPPPSSRRAGARVRRRQATYSIARQGKYRDTPGDCQATQTTLNSE